MSACCNGTQIIIKALQLLLFVIFAVTCYPFTNVACKVLKCITQTSSITCGNAICVYMSDSHGGRIGIIYYIVSCTFAMFGIVENLPFKMNICNSVLVGNESLDIPSCIRLAFGGFRNRASDWTK